MKIINLKGLFTGQGFKNKDGRRPLAEDAGFVAGPLTLEIDEAQGIITRIVPQKNTGNATFTDECVIDGEGLIATASFHDSHTHMLFAGTRAPEFFRRWSGQNYQQIASAGGGIHNTVRDTAAVSDEDLLSATRKRLLQSARCGCTSVEIKTGYGQNRSEELRQLKLIHALKSDRTLPRVFGTFLGLHALKVGQSESAFVDEMISLLPDIKKDGWADFADAFPEKGFFSLAESLRFAKAAQAHGLKIKIHADELSNLESSEAFAALGALSVDHLQFISDAGVTALQKSSTVATLLPATSFFLGLPYTDARRLVDAGTRVAIASDFNPGTAPQLDLRFSMLLAASQMKLSPAEILCAVTLNAAASLGLNSATGTITEGAPACLALWPSSGTKAGLEEIVLGEVAPRVVLDRARILSLS